MPRISVFSHIKRNKNEDTRTQSAWLPYSVHMWMLPFRTGYPSCFSFFESYFNRHLASSTISYWGLIES